MQTDSQLLVDPNLAHRLAAAAIASTMLREEARADYVSEWFTMLARTEQIAPVRSVEDIAKYGDYVTWLFLGGRGAGKTRSGAEWVHNKVREGYRRGALVSPTASDLRKVMIEGPAGILATCPEDLKPILYEPSKLKITYGNGAELHLYSAEEAKRLRGPEHDFAWADEVCFWKDIDDLDSESNPWNMLMFGLRMPPAPQVMVSTTPLPLKWLTDKTKGIMNMDSTVVTTSTTYDNIDNLAEAFINTVIKRYEGTRLGKQELLAQILDDIPGALWSSKMLSDSRIDSTQVPDLRIIRTSIDPAVTSKRSSAETGIVIGGVGPCLCKGFVEDHLFILRDLSIKASPLGWARRAVRGYDEYECDGIIGEVNNGGDLIEANLRSISKNISYRSVHASRGKFKRAEPVSALWEQGKAHMVGVHPELEDQLCRMTPDPVDLIDRADALVWLGTDLMLDDSMKWRAY